MIFCDEFENLDSEISNLLDVRALEADLQRIFDCITREHLGVDSENLSLELVFVDSENMREINLQNRGKNSCTDVLSFGLEFREFLACLDSEILDSENSDFQVPLGSIVINSQMAQAVANEQNHALDSEIKLLFIHALLHILGFDHEKDSGEHRAQEAHYMQAFGLPRSLIDRNS